MTTFANRITFPCTVTTIAETDGRDAVGNPLHEASDVETVCYYRQESTEEHTADQDTALTAYRVHLPAGTIVSKTSTIAVDDLLLTVTGDPHVAKDQRTGDVWFIRCTATASS